MIRLFAVRALALALLAGLACGGAMAEEKPSPAGYWLGSIEYPGGPLEITILLLQDKAGGWQGEIDLPAQGVRNLRLDSIAVQGAAVSFGVAAINGKPFFTGDLSADGQLIVGNLTQMERNFMFTLRRSSEPPEDDTKLYAAYEKAGVAGEGLSGTWLGLLEHNPARIRLILKIAEGDDGTLSGSMASPDQGGKEIPIESIVLDGKIVKMSLASLYANYQAEMNTDGSALYGSWEQTGQTMTLNFKRQAADKQ
jgi:hypothetical protein